MRGVVALVVGLFVTGSAGAAEPIPGFAPKDQSAQRRLESRWRTALARPAAVEVRDRVEGTDWPDQEIEVSGPPALARALTVLGRKGWRPRRTVLLSGSPETDPPAPDAGQPDTRTRVRVRLRVDPDASEETIAEAGIEVLRLASAALPWREHGETIERALSELDELSAESAGAFDRNPPPTRVLREALAEARRAAGAWDTAAAAWLQRVQSLRAGPDRDAAGRAARALLATPASIDLDPARRAVAAVDRGALAAALLSASVPARAIGTRLREATAALALEP